MRRKSYLLLELLIAFTILALCAIPLVRNPMHSAKSEIDSYEKMELEHFSELGFAEILEKLYQEVIPTKAFEAKSLETATHFIKDKITVKLPGIVSRDYHREIFLWTHAEKEGIEHNLYKMIYVKFVFIPIGKPKKNNVREFTHRAFIELQKK